MRFPHAGGADDEHMLIGIIDQQLTLQGAEHDAATGANAGIGGVEQCPKPVSAMDHPLATGGDDAKDAEENGDRVRTPRSAARLVSRSGRVHCRGVAL